MYSLRVADETGRLTEIDTHDTCESAVEFMLSVWYEDGQAPPFACVAGPVGEVAAVLRPSHHPNMVVVTRKGGVVSLHVVRQTGPLVTL